LAVIILVLSAITIWRWIVVNKYALEGVSVSLGNILFPKFRFEKIQTLKI